MTRTSVISLVILGSLAACATNPATGERQLLLVPAGQAAALGQESANEIAKSVGLVEGEIAGYVSSIGKRLAEKSEEPALPWSFQVLDDPAVNAFALPGGYIFVTRGILAHLGSEAELASVLGHEVGHVTGKHSVDQMSKATLAGVGLGVLGAVSDTAKKVSQAGGAGLQVLFLKYGRDDEYQADELGVRYAGRAGYDVREMPKVFEVLERVGSKGKGGVPEWLSTHPAPQNRIGRIREAIAASGVTSGTVARDEYLRRIDGITYGEDPRQGYFQGSRFIHPTLGFELTFPEGWKTANTAQAVAAQSAGEDAVIQLGLVEAASPEAALEAFLKKEGIQAGTRGAGTTSLPSASSTFQATTKEGVIGGLVTFISHGGKTYGLLGLTTQDKAATYMPAFEATRGKFMPLSDPALSQVEPATVRIVEVPRAMTLAELYETQRGPVPIDEIALINGMEPGTRLQAGQLVKLVRGGRQAAGK